MGASFDGGQTTARQSCLAIGSPVVDSVDNHTDSCDQRKTKNCVHTQLGPGGNNKRGWVSISGEICQVKLECHQ